MLCYESRARAIDADAGIFHTGHPCPDEKRRASLRAALRVFLCLRECVSTHSTSNRNRTVVRLAVLLLGRSGASRDRHASISRRSNIPL